MERVAPSRCCPTAGRSPESIRPSARGVKENLTPPSLPLQTRTRRSLKSHQEKIMFENPFARSVVKATALTLLLGVVLSAPVPSCGQFKGGAKGKQPDFIPAGYDDYQNMLDQLGIKKMRRGRDAKVKDTSDEATAN